MDTCSTCRNPLVPGARFCGLCGQRVSEEAAPQPTAPVAAAPPPQPTAPVTPPPAPRAAPAPEPGVTPWPAAEPERRRPPLGVLAGVAAALLLVLGLVLGAVLMGLGGDDSATPAADQTGSELDPAPSAPTVGGAEESDAAAASVECWNGTERPEASDCPAVRGLEGMRWAFPPLDKRFDRCEETGVYDGKVRAYACNLTTARGNTARVVFSEWASYAEGDGHYRRKYGAPDDTDGQFNSWETTYIKTDYQTSRMFSGGLPYSVTVASSDPGIADAVMAGFTFRPDSEVKPYLG